MNLTIEDIKRDIAGFEDRIQKAQDQLHSLPEGYLPFKDHKAREKRRRDLQGEIQHATQLIAYAYEGIKIRQNGGLINGRRD